MSSGREAIISKKGQTASLECSWKRTGRITFLIQKKYDRSSSASGPLFVVSSEPIVCLGSDLYSLSSRWVELWYSDNSIFLHVFHCHLLKIWFFKLLMKKGSHTFYFFCLHSGPFGCAGEAASQGAPRCRCRPTLWVTPGRAGWAGWVLLSKRQGSAGQSPRLSCSHPGFLSLGSHYRVWTSWKLTRRMQWPGASPGLRVKSHF